MEDVAKEEYIEWHPDNKTRGHLWAYVSVPFHKKDPDPILGIEIKCEHSHGLVVSWPSIHEDGEMYTPVDINMISRWDAEVGDPPIRYKS